APSSSAGNPASTGAERKSGLKSDAEGAFHEIRYPVAFIMPGPPVVRYLPAHPPKIFNQLSLSQNPVGFRKCS
ncbi:MAG: hypothetical protein LBP71_07300, partial [Spirochaetaceae bacterium]|nr:hypothetical protein [Spirochaetaceae bacterium]